MSRPKGSTLEVRRAHAMALQMYLKKFTFTALLVNFGKYLVGCLSISRNNKEFTCFRKDPLVRGIMIMSLPLGDRIWLGRSSSKSSTRGSDSLMFSSGSA
jgi:hypothetical protein